MLWDSAHYFLPVSGYLRYNNTMEINSTTTSTNDRSRRLSAAERVMERAERRNRARSVNFENEDWFKQLKALELRKRISFFASLSGGGGPSAQAVVNAGFSLVEKETLELANGGASGQSYVKPGSLFNLFS